MILSHPIEKHYPESMVIHYELMENNIVGMGKRDGVHSYTIIKIDNESHKIHKKICDGIKNKNAVMAIWHDVKMGVQK